MGKSLSLMLALGLAGLLGASGAQVPPAAHAASVRDAASRETSSAALAEHRYRIIGKVRPAFVWVARRFGVTYAPEHDGPPLPVQIFYQPSFWLRIELRLDDAPTCRRIRRRMDRS